MTRPESKPRPCQERRYGNKRAGGFFDCFCFFMGDVAKGLCADGNGIVINVTNNGFVSAS